MVPASALLARPSRILRRIGAVALSMTITAVVFAAAAFGGIVQSGQPPSATLSVGPAASHSAAGDTDGKIVVAVVLGRSGSDAADMLAPYEVLASSPYFAVYTIADSTDPARLDGGIWVQPDHAFADIANGTAPHRTSSWCPQSTGRPSQTSRVRAISSPTRTRPEPTYSVSARDPGCWLLRGFWTD